MAVSLVGVFGLSVIRHDRIIPLKHLSDHPATDWLEMVMFLPPDAQALRRIWLMTPHLEPKISIDEVILTPKKITTTKPRWIDYGTAELHIQPPLRGFTQLRLTGLALW